MHRACPACSRHINSILSLTPARGYWWHLSTVDTFAGYGAAVPAQPANSRHITEALETNLCDVFISLGHFQPHEVAPLITEAPQQRVAGSHGVQRTDPPHSLPSASLWNRSALDASSKINSERFLTPPPMLPILGRTLLKSSLVTECSCL